MRFSLSAPLAWLTIMATGVAAEKMLTSNSLNTCQEDSMFTASLFKVTFTPNNNSASVDIVATSSVEGSVIFDVAIAAYGYQIIKTTVNPCDAGLAGLCPMTAGKIPLNFVVPVPPSAVSQIPGIAYDFPDLDATVRVYLNMTSTGKSVACVEADISNGKTVDLVGVKWALAVIAGLALISSAIVNGMGHSNAAAHIASGAMSLFGFFQAQAMLGLTAVHLPPVVMSWTQDFQWSMGIIKVDFMQDIFTWYQRATGGTPSTIFDQITTISVQVEKRGIPAAALNLYRRAAAMMPSPSAMPILSSLIKRGSIQTGSGSYVVYGIQRVAFKAGIESTNLFMTGLTFFCVFVVFTIIGVAIFKGIVELAARQKWLKPDTFLEFRNGWLTVLKGILFRMTLIGYPQMAILCLWEFTQVDSAAEVVLAVFFFFGMSATLGWAAFKVIRIARRSVAMHRNPAYILFSDPQALNKWGFLYIQFRASAYYFIIPFLGYLVVKALFLAFAQSSGTAQAIGFLLIEAAALIAASVLRPWMDKSTNSFNIAICVVNFINSIFLLMFSDVFNAPALVNGVIGLVLFFLNAIFALVLLLMVIITTIIVFVRKNPDTRYQFMADDRASFMKSQSQLTGTTELDALAATARGDKAGFYKPGLDLDEDNESVTTQSLRRRTDQSLMMNPPHGPSNLSSRNLAQSPRSPADPSVPLFPADGTPSSRGGLPSRAQSPYGASPATSFRQQNNASPAGLRGQNPSTPWQRGAGYEH